MGGRFSRQNEEDGVPQVPPTLGRALETWCTTLGERSEGRGLAIIYQGTTQKGK